MENELTHDIPNTYPVTRNTMDENIDQKDLSDNQPDGGHIEENDKAKKEKENQLKRQANPPASRERQIKAKQAWELEIKKREERGQKIPDEIRVRLNELILQGIEPRHMGIYGASLGNSFSEFNAEQFKNYKQLYDLALELKEAGSKEELTELRLEEFKKRLYDISELYSIPDDVRFGFEKAMSEAILKSQSSNETISDDESAESANSSSNEKLNLSGDVGFEEIRQLLSDMSDPKMPQEETVADLKRIAVDLLQPYSYERKELQIKRKELGGIIDEKDPQEFHRRLTNFLNEAVVKRKENYAAGRVEVKQEIGSIQDLAKLIMNKQESELYAIGNKYALIDIVQDPKTGESKEIFRPDNFLIWVRDQIIQLHDDNRTSEMQPLQAVAIESYIKTVTIYTMQRFKGQYFRDESTGQIMTDLADTAVNMCYLFGFFRNMDLAYKQVMNSDEDLPKTIVGIHAKNDVTHGENWATFLSMPDRFGQAKRDGKGNVILDEKGSVAYERDNKVGDAELIANDIYYNLSDIEELKDIVGLNGALVTKEGFKRTLFLKQILAGKKHEWDDGPDEDDGFYDKNLDNFYILNKETGKKDYIFNKDGSLNKKNYLAFVNFFNAPTPDKTTVDFVRDLIRLTIAEKAGIETGFAKPGADLQMRRKRYEDIKAKTNIDDAEKDYKRHVNSARINSKFAEYSSFVQQRPLMIAARNDVNRRGYDASTKLDLNYIVRQSGSGTAGPIGNTEFLKHQIIKNFGVDFVAGLKTESKKSPYEIFRAIRKVMNNNSLSIEQKEEEKSKLLAELRFQDNAASDYSSNGVKRSYDIFHQIVDAHSLDLNKIITRNIFEGIKYNTAEFEKQIKDDFIKPMRYAFSSNAALKYGQMYRGFEQMKDGMPVYKWKTLADHMFGDEVMDDIRDDAIKNKLGVVRYDDQGNKIDTSKMTVHERYAEYLNSQDARGRIVKNITRARLAAELRKHRNRWGPAERWNADMVNKFLMALQTIKEYTKDEKGNIVETDKRFFEDKDIAWIRQHSDTGYKSMIAKESLAGIGKGLGKGVFESFKDFLSNTFKS